MPIGEFVPSGGTGFSLKNGIKYDNSYPPVTITTLPFILLLPHQSLGLGLNAHVQTYWLAESPAILRIFGIFSKVPGSSSGLESCSFNAWSRRFGAELILPFMEGTEIDLFLSDYLAAKCPQRTR